MTRFAALLCAVVATLAVAAPARAAARPPVVGIGEQVPDMFSDPYWWALGIKDVRVLASWDALRTKWQREDLDTYMNAARVAGARVLLAFGHSRDDGRHHVLPSVARFTREFLRFRSRYPWVHDYLTWNEGNHCSQPTCRRPEVAAAYYDAIRRNCPGCTVVGGDVLDTSQMPKWVKRFRRATKAKHLIWGLHNYIDANRFRTRGTMSLLKAVKGEVWFTETGGVVVRRNRSKIAFPGSVSHAAVATRWVFRLAALSPRIRRVYFYHWSPSAPDANWDSALVDRRDRPRPAYTVLQQWLARHRPRV